MAPANGMSSMNVFSLDSGGGGDGGGDGGSVGSDGGAGGAGDGSVLVEVMVMVGTMVVVLVVLVVVVAVMMVDTVVLVVMPFGDDGDVGRNAVCRVVPHMRTWISIWFTSARCRLVCPLAPMFSHL